MELEVPPPPPPEDAFQSLPSFLQHEEVPPPPPPRATEEALALATPRASEFEQRVTDLLRRGLHIEALEACTDHFPTTGFAEGELKPLLEAIGRSLETYLGHKDSFASGLCRDLEASKRDAAELQSRNREIQAELDQLRTTSERQEQRLNRKVATLEWDLAEARRVESALRAQVALQAPPPAPTTTISEEEVMSRMAQLECRLVQEAPQGEQATLRRKVLSKWHPDKAGYSEGHRQMATRVFQELCNLFPDP